MNFSDLLSPSLICRVCLIVAGALPGLGQTTQGAENTGAPSGLIDFEEQVAPLLLKRCLECHERSDPSGKFSISSKAEFLVGGKSGPVFDADDPTSSHFLHRLEDGEMPPEKQGHPQRLPEEEIAVFRDWLSAGAPWPDDRQLDLFERTNDSRAGRDWWSLQAISRPEVAPIGKTQTLDRHPIDVFIRARLEKEKISAAPRADRRTLLRRLYYDLIGLPPTQKQLDDFVSDQSPDAWVKTIDELLDRPQYGERWGRYWLDLVRYADTSGYERDQEKTFAWKYRDWVVDAFNSDMPYSDFVTHQLAGDEIETPTEQSQIATGFLRLGTWNDEPNDSADYVYDRLEDLVHTTSSAFIALTVKCARCHSHKFDPITQEDYYRMASAFWPGPLSQRNRDWLGGPNAKELGVENVLGWTDLSADAKPLHILRNGERQQPMGAVIPASLSSVPTLERTFDPPHAGSRTTRRRLQWAQWLTDPQNPLTARVFVNRLWQHHFGKALVRTPNNFGYLADPPTHPELLDWLAAEFLSKGGSVKAMHRLILTSETWQQSSLHPRAMEIEQTDDSNRLWWRAERRRLDAEALRDSMLMVSGELDLKIGGEGFKVTVHPEALEGLSRKTAAWLASPAEDQKRRSIYLYLKRGLLPPMMSAFDLCDTSQSCGKRDVTTVPTQALVMLNNSFVHERSQHLAAILFEQTPHLSNPQNHLMEMANLAWRHILMRDPTERELESVSRYFQDRLKVHNSVNGEINTGLSPQQLTLASLCHVLINSNEFVYLD
ncbi:MAG: hypothetical protein ACI9R3_001361 [Verrucomicrobiales bacterium]|jgi:hypothetical protein